MKTLLDHAMRSTRSALCISQEELAARAGLHRTYVSDLERGARNPSLQSVQKPAQALELSLPMLFERANGDKQLVEILLMEDDTRDVELTMYAVKKAEIPNPINVARDGIEALNFLFATGRHATRRGDPLPGVILLWAETYIVKPVGFQNFIEVASRLSLAWVLVKPNGTLSTQPSKGIFNRR